MSSLLQEAPSLNLSKFEVNRIEDVACRFLERRGSLLTQKSWDNDRAISSIYFTSDCKAADAFCP